MGLARAVAVTSKRRVQRLVRRALAPAGWKVAVVPTDAAVFRDRLDEPADLYIFWAEDQSPEQLRSMLQDLNERLPNAIPLLVTGDIETDEVFRFLTNEGLNNLVSNQGGIAAAQESIDEAELIVTCQKLFRKDIFGIDKYMLTWGLEPREVRVQSTADKARAIDDLDSFLQEIDLHGSFLPAIKLVADELLMNAIFNAPRDENGHPKYADLDRGKPLRLEQNEAVTLQYTCDGRYVAVAVSDSFGSLDRNVIMKYLEHAFIGAPAQVRAEAAGSGLGLYMVFTSITQLIFNIHPGVKTETIATFYVREGVRAFRSAGRSLNIFVVR